MANVKITSLPASTTPLAGTEVLPIVQSTVTKQVSVANLTAGRAVSAASLTLSTALPVASGGTGTTTPSLVAGTNVTITGTWPNQTVAAASSGGTVTSVALSGGTTGLTVTGSPITTAGTMTLAGTLAVANGGTGTASPSLVAGTNITITGTWPNQTVTAAGGGGGGTVTSVAATVPSIFSISGSPITTSGTLAMTYSGTALPVVNGGTGETSYTNGQLLIGNTTGNTLTKSTLTAGSGITITNGTGSITIAAAGGGGDVFGPASSTDNAITRFDSTTGKLIQNSLVTVADDGAIVAPQAGSTIPFYFANQAAFPSASTYHGALAHSHADGAMFYAHGGVWVRLLDYVTPGTNGNVLTASGGVWTSAAPASGGASLSNDTSTATDLYPLFANATSGTPTTVYTSNAKLLYKPSTGELQASEVVASNGIFVNNATVAASYTVASGTNALSVGPITIASGQSVTVTGGQRWVVL